jgi:hypothetical protein
MKMVWPFSAGSWVVTSIEVVLGMPSSEIDRCSRPDACPS